MQSIHEILKHLEVSKPFASAVFISTAVLLFGPLLFPSQIPVLAGGIRIAAIAALVFSGTYIGIWFLIGSHRIAYSFIKEVVYICSNKKLSNLDEVFLELAARAPGNSLNLYTLDYSNELITQIELSQHGKQLEKRGLVSMSYFDDSIFTLTERGKAVAVKILVKKRQHNNA